MTQESNIDWEQALDLLQSGSIVQVGQSHSGGVTLTDEDGQRYVTQQPEIDAIFRAVMELEPEKGDRITFMTE